MPVNKAAAAAKDAEGVNSSVIATTSPTRKTGNNAFGLCPIPGASKCHLLEHWTLSHCQSALFFSNNFWQAIGSKSLPNPIHFSLGLISKC
jgi:hypothetical protein